MLCLVYYFLKLMALLN